MNNILVTGGAGFIGSNFVEFLVNQDENYNITVIDKLTYAGSKENLEEFIEDIEFIKGDIKNHKKVNQALEGADTVFNLAAESHVDRSIEGPEKFIKSNVLGTQVLLEQSRKKGVEKFVQIGTDEVYGSIKKDSFSEKDNLDPSSPYSASKASADLLCNSYYKTYGFPVTVTRCTNNYGPKQFPEKLIPVIIKKAMNNEKIPLYGDGENIRDWIYVTDHCRGLKTVAEKGDNGEVYNIGADNELKNKEVAKKILDILRKDKNLIEYVKDRPGHDFRYSLDSGKIKEIGWTPKITFEEGIQKTINWYKNNYSW